MDRDLHSYAVPLTSRLKISQVHRFTSNAMAHRPDLTHYIQQRRNPISSVLRAKLRHDTGQQLGWDKHYSIGAPAEPLLKTCSASDHLERKVGISREFS